MSKNGTLESIGDRLRKIRTEQKLTAKQLSELSGVPEKTIYRIETGEVQDPKVSSLEPLIKALNCTADELLFHMNSIPESSKIRRAFLSISQLETVEETEIILEVIRKYCLASTFENTMKLQRIPNEEQQSKEAQHAQ